MPETYFKRVETLGEVIVEGFHLLGLFVIGATIVWASWAELLLIIEEGRPGIKDVLLLFIYLELGAMVGIYFKTKRLPVRFLIYIAITALTRLLAIDVKVMEDLRILAITGAILLLSLSVLVLRYCSSRFPSRQECRYLVKDFGTSQSPKSTRQRDSRYCP
ncbi:MAG: phosphate-starvation-inducible PsiE family protein, partial [Candidatus Sedimenticola endophacoides]